MSPISSDTLFHFTSTLENMRGILTNEFRPRLSFEDFSHIGRHMPEVPQEFLGSGVPMVSFCDIPLSQVGKHLETYGHYGIGLTKSWGMKNDVTPLMYVHEKSIGPYSAAVMLKMLLEEKNRADPNMVQQLHEAGRFVYYMKPYVGRMIRGGARTAEIRFYDEREWRYVPSDVEQMPAVYEHDFVSSPTRTAADRRVASLPPLSFEPSDISYIVVKTEDEILPMVRMIKQIKGPKYPPDAVTLLTTRIISADRIAADL